MNFKFLLYNFIGLIGILSLLFAVRVKLKRSKKIEPRYSIHHTEFRKRVRTGDLLGTLSSNNFMSRFHSFGLMTPIAHVGIAVVEEEGTVGKVYMFESGAPRGAQLRDLDDYMNEGADRLWWRHLDVCDLTRENILQEIEKHCNHPYSWSFLRNLPMELFGFDPPGLTQEDFGIGSSCADMIASIYHASGIRFFHKTRDWLPMHFFEDLTFSFVNKHKSSSINKEFKGEKQLNIVRDPVNVLFR